MTTFPLATLGPTIGPAGISAPSYADILASLQASAEAIFGSDIYLDPDSQDGQLLSIIALAINDENQSIIAAFNAFSPTFAQGAQLSSVVKLNGLARQVPTNSTAVLTIVGTVGTVIANGVAGDANGNQWALPPTVTVPLSGSIDVTATATTQGDVTAAANSITSILTPTRGWQTVTNPAAAIPGAPVESDATLRQRQTVSTALPSQTPLDGIIAGVADLVGVVRYAAYENVEGTTDANGLPGHSIAIVVEGGDVAEIAQTISNKKTPGTGTYGTTSEIVYDQYGVPNTINFFVLAEKPLAVEIDITALSGFVSTTEDTIKQSLADFVNGLSIGEDSYLTRLYTPANLGGTGTGATFVVTAVRQAIIPASPSAIDVAIDFNAAATLDLTNVTVNVT